MGLAPMPSRVQCGWAVLRSLLALLSCGSSLAVLSRAKSSVFLGTVVTAGCGSAGHTDFGVESGFGDAGCGMEPHVWSLMVTDGLSRARC